MSGTRITTEALDYMGQQNSALRAEVKHYKDLAERYSLEAARLRADLDRRYSMHDELAKLLRVDGFQGDLQVQTAIEEVRRLRQLASGQIPGLPFCQSCGARGWRHLDDRPVVVCVACGREEDCGCKDGEVIAKAKGDA